MKCMSCRFAVVDEPAGDRDWTAYKCDNPKSEYHKSLINIDKEGKKHKRISWSGCEYGERMVKANAKEALKAMPLSRLSGTDGGTVLPQTHAGIQPAVQPGRKISIF